VIGVLADALGFEAVFCGIGVIGVGLMLWTARTPAAKPEATARCAARGARWPTHDIRTRSR
jgi:hypothetical protein